MAEPLSITENVNNCYSKLRPKLSSKIGNSTVNFDRYTKKCSSVKSEDSQIY